MLACAAILIVLTTHTVVLKQVKTLLPFHPTWGFLYGAIHYVPSDLRYDVIVVRFVYFIGIILQNLFCSVCVYLHTYLLIILMKKVSPVIAYFIFLSFGNGVMLR